MMKKYLILLFSVFILFPFNAQAKLCVNEDKIKYSNMAKNISVNYEYQENDNDIIFNIKFNNIPEKFRIYDINNDIEYGYSGSEFIIPNVTKNSNYKFAFYIDDDRCKYEVLYIKYISIPAYNQYYKDEVCNDIRDYKLCSKWLNVNYSYDDWKKEILKYKNSLIQQEEKQIIEPEQNSILKIIIDFYVDYYMLILLTIILLSFGGIYFYNRKHDLF